MRWASEYHQILKPMTLVSHHHEVKTTQGMWEMALGVHRPDRTLQQKAQSWALKCPGLSNIESLV